MRRTHPVRIGDLWNEYLDGTPAVARKLAEARAVKIWAAVVGPAVASYTESVSVRDGILTARISSAAARQEIFMRRAALAAALNRALGVGVIKAVNVR